MQQRIRTMRMTRSLRSDVRNPLLRLPSAAGLQKLPAEAQEALRALLKDISADARIRADECWRKHKPPMACYWKAVAVYANHSSRLCRPQSAKPETQPGAQGAQEFNTHEKQ